MRSSRRSMLKAGVALTAASWPKTALAESASEGPDTTARHSSFDPWVEVHAANLRHNVAEVHHRVSGQPILAVIKNNGYGAGTANVARILEPLPAVHGFAVIKLHEALGLRHAGVRKPVLLMGPLAPDEIEVAVAADIAPMVYTPVGEALERVAGRLGRTVPIHVCIDTGIGRVGIPHHDAEPLLRDLAGRSSVRIEGIMMTFTEDVDFDGEQLRRFQALCRSLTTAGIAPGRRHAASSFALFQRPDSFLDMVRPGMALFGVYPDPSFRSMGIMDLRPALSLKARVLYVKQLKKGQSAGYERAYKAERDVWVATLPLGHADGWPRVAAKGAKVRIGDRLYPLVASVSASHCIAELGPEPTAAPGDVAVAFDDRAGSRPEDVSAACGASVYDLLMHLNPLMPRRIET